MRPDRGSNLHLLVLGRHPTSRAPGPAEQGCPWALSVAPACGTRGGRTVCGRQVVSRKRCPSLPGTCRCPRPGEWRVFLGRCRSGRAGVTREWRRWGSSRGQRNERRHLPLRRYLPAAAEEAVQARSRALPLRPVQQAPQQSQRLRKPGQQAPCGHTCCVCACVCCVCACVMCVCVCASAVCVVWVCMCNVCVRV